MKRVLSLFLLLCASLCLGQEMYMGLYMGGSKLGYGYFIQTEEMYQGKMAKRSDSTSVLDAGMLGAAMSIKISSTSWYDQQDKPIRMKFLVESGGRSQITDAVFGPTSIKVTSDNSGTKTVTTLALPKDGPVLDDPIMPLLNDGSRVGAKKVYYVLDPMTLGLVKNTATLKGQGKTTVKGKSYDATVILVDDPRAPTTIYVSAKGDLIKAEGPMGIEMIPETKEEALGKNAGDYRPSTDLAISSSLKTDKPVTNPTSLKRLKLKVTGRDLSRLPSDEHQTVKKSGNSWTVDIHPPVQNRRTAVTIAKAAAAKREWTKPTTHIASNNADIKKLSKSIVGNKTNVLDASLAIKNYVFKIMKPNAGIGVLRDATEVLQTKEGVCRDYAILTAALLRASNIPTRLASGLVNWDGTFYYHAWVEIWEGKRWIGLDATAPFAQITPAHVKLSQGNVDEAYVFTLLDKVKLEVLSMQRK